MSDHIKARNKAFSLFTMALFAASALLVVSAIPTVSGAQLPDSSESSPLDSMNYGFDQVMGKTVYVSVGASVYIYSCGDDGGFDEFFFNVESVTSGYGLSVGTATQIPDSACNGLAVSGTITRAGTITISGEWFDIGNPSTPADIDATIIAVEDTTPVTSISISGSTTGEVGSTITLTATTSPSSADDRTVSWSITSGSSRASITSQTDTSTGGRAVISLNSAGSVTVRATANDGSGVYATRTITITEPEVLVTSVSISGSTTVNVGSTLTLTATTTPTSADDRHVNWSITSGSSRVTYTTSDTTTGGRIVLTGVSAGSVTVRATAADGGGAYATYTITVVDPSNDFVLSYNANGGTGAPSSQSYTSTSSTHTATISATVPSRSGYTFLGWATTSSASSPQYGPGDTIVLSPGTTTLYAVWEQVTYTATLRYSATGATNVPSDQTYTGTSTSSHTFTISSLTPVRSGYVFLGWSTSSGATSAAYQPGGTISVGYNSTVTLYAVWESASLSITTTQGDVSLTVGQRFSYTVGTSHDGCVVTVSGASWLSVSGSTISGTATAAGTYDVTVTVSKDGGYTSATQTFTITVSSVLEITSEPEFDGIYAYVKG